jgi:hypothetical protein
MSGISRFSGFRLQAGFQRAELRSGTISSQKGIARLPMRDEKWRAGFAHFIRSQ